MTKGKDVPAAADGGKTTFIPSVTFDGYPFGEKVTFRAGVESIPVPEDYAALIREKGLAETASDKAV